MKNHYAIIPFRSHGGYVLLKMMFEQESRQIKGYFQKVTTKKELNTAIDDWKKTQEVTYEAEFQQRIYRLDNKYYSLHLPPSWFDEAVFDPAEHRPRYGGYNVMLVFSNLTVMKLHLTRETMQIHGYVRSAYNESDLKRYIDGWIMNQHFPDFVESDGKLQFIGVPFLLPQGWKNEQRFVNPYR